MREILAGQFIIQLTPTCINMVGTFATVVGNNKFTCTLWEGEGGGEGVEGMKRVVCDSGRGREWNFFK